MSYHKALSLQYCCGYQPQVYVKIESSFKTKIP